MYGFKSGAAPKDKPKVGKIKGPGTGTSDSIKTKVPSGTYIMPADSTEQVGEKTLGELGKPVPVNLSNGEYQMPPEQVHAVGAQVLDQMKGATHTPVAAMGFKPQGGELYFADGGLVDDERRSQAMPSAPAAQPAAQAAEPGVAPQMAPASFLSMQREPSMPRSGQLRQMPQGEPLGASGVVGGFQAAGQRAAAGIQGAADQVAQAGRGFVAGGQAMTDQAARAAGSAVGAASGALNYLNRGDPVRDAIGAAGDFFSRSAQQARQADYGATGAPSSSAPAPAATTPIADQPAARAGYGFTPADQQGPAPGMRVSGTSAPEIRRIDGAPGLNSPLFTNLPVGEAISGMQGGTVNTVPAFRAPASAQAGGDAQDSWQGQQGPAVSVIGDRRTERDRYGDLMNEVARLSQGGRAGRNKAAALVSAYAAAQRGEEADMRDQASARELGFRQEDAAARNAQSARELQERSADRTGRHALDERRLAGEETARGFEVRGQQRVENLYQQFENAKTPEERAGITEQLRAISGKEAPNRFTVVPGGQEVTEQGLLRTVPSVVLNNQTGQQVDLGAAPRQGGAQATQRPVGTTSTVNGKTAAWDGSKWVPR